MELNRITYIDSEGTTILYNAPRYFSEFIRESNKNFQCENNWKIFILNDIVYPLDADGNIIREAGRPLNDILRLADLIYNNSLAYCSFKPANIDWCQIVFDSEYQLREIKSQERIQKNISSFYECDNPSQVNNSKPLHSIQQLANVRLNPDEICIENLWLDFWKEGELACLFADANLGKSILAVQIGCHIAQTKKVLFCDYEMSDNIFFSRYHDSQGNKFLFPSNFFRSKPDPEIFISNNPELLILKDIERLVVDNDFKVVIIDNISFLGRDCYAPKKISTLIYRLKILQEKYKLSILVIAHTGKRKPRALISKYDLQGHNRLFNFVDSCFAIGKASAKEDNLYIKQLKSRSGIIKYDRNNVLLIKRVFSDSWLHFSLLNTAPEKDCVDTDTEYADTQCSELECKVKELAHQKLSQRMIASRLNISPSKVNRILKNLVKQ